MKMLQMIAAAGLVVAGLVASATAGAQSYYGGQYDYNGGSGYNNGYDRYQGRNDRRDGRGDYRDQRDGYRDHYDRGNHRGWYKHNGGRDRCWTETRHHQPVTVCRR
jgi:hypothetical protein